ncbi:MAG: HipA domain-containing protein [Eubacteriales bacterium]|nr:HipA domain-containing protein [Eubacteriales bacterium]
MKYYRVSIEINGDPIPVGHINCDDLGRSNFTYDSEYLNHSSASPISVSLPLQAETFSETATKKFFDGLLPEGFTRKTVAGWMHVDEKDYVSLLGELGRECLGAILISEDSVYEEAAYEKLSVGRVRELANEGASISARFVTEAHLSLAGASGKVGLYYDAAHGDWYLPHGSAPSTHIVKQSHVRLGAIVTNEQLCMMTAAKLGLRVPNSFIINTGNAGAGNAGDGDVLFATERYDRTIDAESGTISGLARPYRLHQEDMAQALGIAAADKYERPGAHYLADMTYMLRRRSADPIGDIMMLWRMAVLNFLIGNADGHIKNAGLLYSKNLKTCRLAPAYDVVSTTVYEGRPQDMAYSIGGVYSIGDINEAAFRMAAAEAGIGEKPAMAVWTQMCDGFEQALSEASAELMDQGFSNADKLRESILKTGGYGRLYVNR